LEVFDFQLPIELELEKKYNSIQEKYRKTLKAVIMKKEASGSGCGLDYQYQPVSPAEFLTSKTVQNWHLWKHLQFLIPFKKKEKRKNSKINKNERSWIVIRRSCSNTTKNHQIY
jgi:hypothetical protein